MNTHQTRLNQVSRILEATPQTLAVMLAGIEEELLTWRPAPGEWSVKEIIGHLIETDREAFAGRIHLILAEKVPELPAWDMPAAVAARRDNARSLPDLLDELAAPRPDYSALIRELSEEDLARPCRHRLGELTIGDFVFEWPFHDLGHIAQIANTLRGRFLPLMGETMRRAVS